MGRRPGLVMRIRSRFQRTVLLTAALLVGAIGSTMGFVTYFMHAVYETQEPVAWQEVPAEVRHQFATLFPRAEGVYWEYEEGMYEAEFRQRNGVEAEAIFRPDGPLDRLVTSVPLSELPDKARAYLDGQGRYEVIEPEKLIRNRNIQFEAKLANRLMEWNCVFDAQGNLVSRTRDGPILEGPVEP